MNYQYHMPVEVFFGPPTDYADEFAGLGRRALIVTGRSSASNGSLGDILTILASNGITAEVFDQVEENPSLENVGDATKVGAAFGAEFVIGIGGGSPLDASKACALLLNHPTASPVVLFDAKALTRGAKPVLAVPTTSGTGSEVTPYSVLTRRDALTKGSIPYTIFPMKAFINPAYTYALPDRLTVFTAVDALCHLIEGYLSSRASVLTDMMAEGGICAFGCLREHLSMRRFDNEARAALMSVSTLAGIVITHTKTSLPHQLSYALTCHHGIHHGAACGMLLAEFLRRHPDAKKTSRALAMLGLFDFDAFKDWMDGLLGDGAAMSDADIVRHADELLARPGYDATYPGTVTPDDVRAIYKAAASR